MAWHSDAWARASAQNDPHVREHRSIVSYYGTTLRRILRGPQRLAFFMASSMHAASHAALSLAVAGLVSSLTRLTPLTSPLSTATTLTLRVAGAPRAPDPRLFGVFDALSRWGPISWALFGAVLAVTKCASGVYATYVQRRLSGEVGAALRLELLDALLARHRLRRPRHHDHGGGVGAQHTVAPTSEASAPSHGVAALTEQVHDVELGLQNGVLGGALSVAQLVPLALLLVTLSARTALVAAATLGSFGFVLARLRVGYRRAARRAALERTHLLEAADESVRHAELWVSYGAEAKARARVGELGTRIARSTAVLDARAAAMSGVNEVLAAIALVAGIAVSRLAGLGAADGDKLLAFAVAFFMMYRPLRELTEARAALARASGAYEGLRSMVPDSPGSPEDGVSDAHPTAPAAKAARSWPLAPLELRALRLVHGACAPLSLRVPPGAIVAIAGPTGVGKTSLLRTLLGFERTASGEVVFDGVPLTDASAGPSQRPFAWVPQDAPLLSDTLEANIALGVAPGSLSDELDLLGAGHLWGLLGEARLGPGGRPVSGGERQWIALARAIATRQPILLLDEPTSGLDGWAQQRVLEAIAALRGLRTVLLVTHRPEPLAIADTVVRLDALPESQRAA